MDDEESSGEHQGINAPPTGGLGTGASQPNGHSAIPVVPVSSLLADNAHCIRRIKLCYGVDGQTFENEITPLIRAYAAYVHLLPATPDGAFSEPGGLLRLGLEAGLYSLQGTDSHIFAGRATISVRRQLEPRWRLATFIAGMCAELHRATSRITVQTGPDRRWPAYLAPLSTWLADQQATHYGVQWQDSRRDARSTGLLAIAMVVPQAVMNYLAQHNHSIVPQLLECVGGLRGYMERNVLDDLVQRALALVIDQDLKDRASRGSGSAPGEHLERYLLTALRRVAATQASWIPNSEKSRVWLGKDGLYLLWPAAADDLRRQLEFEQWHGVPRAPDTLMQALLATGLAQAYRADQPLWPIQPPRAKGPMDALLLTSPLVLYASDAQLPAIPEFELVIPPPAATPAPSTGQAPAGASHPPPAPEVSPTSRQPTSGAMPAPVKTQSEPTPTQNLPPDTTATAPVPPPQPPGPSPALAPASAPRLRQLQTLRAPIRLPPSIRDALGMIIESLSGGLLPAQCSVVEGGYFIPVRAFDQLGLQPPTVVRALDDARMLLRPANGGSVNIIGEFEGQALPGVILLERFVAASSGEFAPQTRATATSHAAASL